MKSKWRTCQLGDLITFQRGYDLPKSKMNGDDYPVVGSNGIIGYHNKFTTDEPSITIGRSGNVGNPFIYYGKTWSHNTTLFVKEYKNVEPVFIYYLLKTMDLKHYAGGTAVPTLNRNHIHNLSVKIPCNLEEQKKISSILKSLDDKIELNNQINKNLEQQAQAIFKSWLKNSKSTIKIGDMAQNILDYTPSKHKKVILINSSDVTNGNFNHHSLSENSNLKGHFKKRFKKYDILYSEIRPKNHHYAYCQFDPENYIASTRLMIIRNKSEYISSSLLYQYIMLNKVFNEFTLKTETRSGTFPQGRYEDIAAIQVPYKIIEEQKDITAILDNFYEIIWLNQKENFNLTNIRDTLLPKLMSGEIDVSEINL